jgi:hypothetical protein
MIKPNWNTFKVKFNENPQHYFEWFCYLLFCKEFEKQSGIFRYVNQAGMETNPVKYGDGYTAWEAKFYYEDKLVNHKAEFIKKLETAKLKNPEITKMYFYTPIDWTESSKPTSSKTIQQEDIENCAKKLNIEVVWKGASFFESPFVSIQNEIISKHFFSLDNDVFDYIKEQQAHSENILSEIQKVINFKNQVIEINRDKDLERLSNDSERVSILSGVGGVGKTAIIKKLYEQLKGEIPFYIFKATEFELKNISDLFRETSFKDFIEAHKDENDKIIVVDAAERLLDLKNTDPFKEFISSLIQENWKLIFTTRDDYLEDLNYQFLRFIKLFLQTSIYKIWD